jgi:hypothetical protein
VRGLNSRARTNENDDVVSFSCFGEIYDDPVGESSKTSVVSKEDGVVSRGIAT